MNNSIKTALIIGGVIIAVLLVLVLVLGGFFGWQSGGWSGWGGMMGGWGGMWFMPIFMIIFWGLVIWGIVALIRGAGWAGCCGGWSEPSKPSDSALDVLKKRYARGDIGKEEFEEKKKHLT